MALDAMESCVRDEVARCSKDDGLHEIYRACASLNKAAE
jgi:hypothetical protein